MSSSGLTVETPVKRLARLRSIKITDQSFIVMPPSPANEHGICCLDKYMRLPASQYACVPMPLQSSLTRLPGSQDRFKLSVPPIAFKVPGVPSVEVIPEMLARVTVSQDHIIIAANGCTIRGSPMIERLHLNNRFEFQIHSRLTWDLPNADTAVSAEDGHTVRANTTLAVDIDLPGPFRRIPRGLIESVGNAAFSFSVSKLQSQFMKSLAADYEKWLSDKVYRKDRQQIEMDAIAEVSEEISISNILGP